MLSTREIINILYQRAGKNDFKPKETEYELFELIFESLIDTLPMFYYDDYTGKLIGLTIFGGRLSQSDNYKYIPNVFNYMLKYYNFEPNVYYSDVYHNVIVTFGKSTD